MELAGGRIVLALDALLFAGFGALWWIMPQAMAAKVGIGLTSTGAIIDAQGLYGGLEVGLGSFLAYCALAAARTRLGLVAGTCILCGIALSRLVAIARFGLPDTSVAVLVGLDLLGAVLNLVFLLRYRSVAR
jgi:Domain of unknown function (DUF4345)